MKIQARTVLHENVRMLILKTFEMNDDFAFSQQLKRWFQIHFEENFPSKITFFHRDIFFASEEKFEKKK